MLLLYWFWAYSVTVFGSLLPYSFRNVIILSVHLQIIDVSVFEYLPTVLDLPFISTPFGGVVVLLA